ncbi:uncharacterized protein LOC119579430 [Penaeus monodon]|uniref:uncharacterized protein LOC119579430 n=1 Tax=Penaeus monodon TaxID=6687 RepID=UPI0018A72C79|nr:uncharacterized protein LOC119579430 [Penaeus monodon]
MPKSSVFVRLNWPSKNSETSQDEVELSPCQDVSKTHPLHAEREAVEVCQKGEKPVQSNSPLKCEHIASEDCKQIGQGIKLKGLSSEKEKLVEHPGSGSVKVPSKCNTEHNEAPSSSKVGTPMLDTSHSLDSPLWSGAKKGELSEYKGAETPSGLQTKTSGGSVKEGNGNGKTHKPKTKPKPRSLGKGRKITRSLSASCVSVSTNTDPKDFLELASVASATLPSRRRFKEPTEAPPGESEKVSQDTTSTLETTTKDENSQSKETIQGNVEDLSKEPNKKQSPELQNQKPNTDVQGLKTEKHEEKECKDRNTKNQSNIDTITAKKDNNEETEQIPDIDLEKGYIELPSYVPKEPTKKCVLPDDSNSVSLLPLHHTRTVEEMCNSEYLHPSYFYKNSPQVMSNMVTEEPIKCNSPELVRDDKIPVGVTPPPDTCVVPLSVYPTDFTDIPPIVLPSYNQVNFVKPTFQPPDVQEEKLDLLYPSLVDSDCTALYNGLGRNYSNQRVAGPVGEYDHFAYPMHWSPLPVRAASPQRRQKLDKDISVESCPDVVLQTLESEGSLQQNKPVKKTVTFLLPPEHWDSLISLRESNIGGYPQSGYAELDGALLPPNGQDPYRNTPSPGLHGLPQDRYDGGLEGEGHAGDYPEDGRYPAAESAMVYPPEGVVYGRLLGAPRSPYTINGSVGASAEPLLPSPGMYDEEPPHVQHPAPLPHMSPPTPSLPPPPIQNHDNYAHPNLLRSPSADSGAPRVRWRDPDLHEVIDFLSNPNNVVKANAAAYLQHLCYMDDPTKQKTRILGGIPPLVALLTHDLPELHRNACGALRNLSYGRQNDENKRAIRDASGIPSLVRLLRKTPDNEVKELVTGILWNLSSCEDLKHNIIDDALTVIVSHVIIPCSGWDGGDVERDPNVDVWWSTVFKNASGVLRNISSAGEYARTKLRQCNGLVDSLLTVIKSAIQGSSHDNKSVENCVCILRNLSYRCQEVEDPNYDKNQPPTQSRATATAKDGEGEGTDTCGRSSEPKDNLCDNLGCFGGSRKKKEAVGGAVKETSTGQRTTGPRTEPLRGMELLWQPEVVVSSYLALLSDCSNPETLEAAAGALQNLAACYWQPSIDVRAAVRKEKGLPILVELLRMEVDRVVCAVATALRNLAIDQRNKELIGKYAMRDLVQKLPSGNTHDSGTSDETIAAVLATLNEVIKKSAEFSRSLLDVGGVERLVNMTRHRGRYSVRVVKFASQVLFSMWGHQELREVYKKAGWKEQDFVSKSVAARNAAGGGANSPTANNTLNRPMASQGGTRYEDRTIQRGQGKAHHQYNRGEEVPMANMGYSGDGGVVPPAGGGKPGEPVYAKVNRDKKRNRQYDSMGPQYGTLGGADDWGGPVYSGSPAASPNFNNSPSMNNNNSNANNNNNNGILLDNTADGQAGDSWV